MTPEKESSVLFCIICASLLAAGFAGWVAGDETSQKYWQAECVKRDFAEYNQRTGEWQWKK